MASEYKPENTLSEEEFVSYEDFNREALSLKDLFNAKDETLENEILTKRFPGPEEIDALTTLAPPDATPAPERQGFTAAKIVEHKSLALHYAAKNSPLAEIKKLVEEQGYDVNFEDPLSGRPLYVAALNGHLDAVRYFIKKGADVHDYSYEYETALHGAIEKGHYEIARALVEQGNAQVNLSNLKNETPINMLIKQYVALIEKGSYKIHKPHNIETMMEITKTLEVFSKHCGDHFLYTVPVAKDYSVDTPVGYYLGLFASRAPTVELRDKLLNLKDAIASVDPACEIYDNAKNLFNIFPNNNNYFLNLSQDKQTIFNGIGHLGCTTTKLASDSISAFYSQLQKTSFDQVKLNVFSKLANIFEAATELKSNGELEEYALKAQARFDNGETILLGSGWNTHFIDVVLSKYQELFITGNSGSRCFQISPGLNFYHMNNPETINSKFMHDMTVNFDKTNFERDTMYEYELIEKVGEKVTPLQLFPNCTWVGHQHGIEASLYVELLNLGIKKEAAGPLASQYYTEWERFHGLFQIDNYMKNPGLPIQALTDMFVDTVGKITNENQFVLKAHANKLCQAMVSSHYLEDFKDWLSEPANQAAKKHFEPYLDISHIIEPRGMEAVINNITGAVKNLFFGESALTKLSKPFFQEDAMVPQDAHSAHNLPVTPHTHDLMPVTEQHVNLVI